MRLVLVYFALFYLFHFEVYAFSDKLDSLRAWFAANVEGRKDQETIDTVKKICVIEVKKGSKHKINIGNIDITNKNTLENFIKLPSIKMPNITIVIVEDELAKKARTASTYTATEVEKLLEQFKKCVLHKLKVLS
ncbi:uncharacterized protein LOC108112439 [Drosophila eugracilis]|uniref:uncharacterized protein LOC108112439 n=1 Tax=Drosophila eugracilis TaxID=29029 RepID=UPI0007E7830F|nr:uncharacterized protein LOC108112439 [Drosophila eugracilis]